MAAINRQNNPILHNFSGTSTGSGHEGKTTFKDLSDVSNTNYTNVYLRVTGLDTPDYEQNIPLTRGIYDKVVELYKNGGVLPEGWKIMCDDVEVDWSSGLCGFAFSGSVDDLTPTTSRGFISSEEIDDCEVNARTRIKFIFDSSGNITGFTQEIIKEDGTSEDLCVEDFLGEVFKEASTSSPKKNPFRDLTNNGSSDYTSDLYLTENDYMKFTNVEPEISSDSNGELVGRIYLRLRPEEEKNIVSDYIPFINFDVNNSQSTQLVTSRICKTGYNSLGEPGKKAYVEFYPNAAYIGSIPSVVLIRAKNNDVG